MPVIVTQRRGGACGMLVILIVSATQYEAWSLGGFRIQRIICEATHLRRSLLLYWTVLEGQNGQCHLSDTYRDQLVIRKFGHEGLAAEAVCAVERKVT
ncbi:hypothetical protein EDC04DRAFT_2192360 [Pisolithus marmoratus]|nr:hypothetical protein EDC04DRAFT_2192360 [Pisolithus marmoratus]